MLFVKIVFLVIIFACNLSELIAVLETTDYEPSPLLLKSFPGFFFCFIEINQDTDHEKSNSGDKNLKQKSTNFSNAVIADFYESGNKESRHLTKNIERLKNANDIWWQTTCKSDVRNDYDDQGCAELNCDNPSHILEELRNNEDLSNTDLENADGVMATKSDSVELRISMDVNSIIQSESKPPKTDEGISAKLQTLSGNEEDRKASNLEKAHASHSKYQRSLDADSTDEQLSTLNAFGCLKKYLKFHTTSSSESVPDDVYEESGEGSVAAEDFDIDQAANGKVIVSNSHNREWDASAPYQTISTPDSQSSEEDESEDSTDNVKRPEHHSQHSILKTREDSHKDKQDSSQTASSDAEDPPPMEDHTDFNLTDLIHILKTDHNVQDYFPNKLVPVVICGVFLWLVIFKLLPKIRRRVFGYRRSEIRVIAKPGFEDGKENNLVTEKHSVHIGDSDQKVTSNDAALET